MSEVIHSPPLPSEASVTALLMTVGPTAARLQPCSLKWNTPSLPLAPPNAHTSFGPSTDKLVT